MSSTATHKAKLLIVGSLQLLSLFFYTASICQDFGERPKINLFKLSPVAYESGMLYLKFRADKINEEPFLIKFDSNNPTVRSSFSSIDSILLKYNANGFKPLFNHQSLKNEWVNRHREWELNTWYGISFDNTTDIIEVIIAFSKLSVIEVAEPIFKIVRYIGDEAIPIDHSPRNVYPLNNHDNVNQYSNISIENERSKFTSNQKWTPNDPLLNNQWHYNKIQLQQAWDYTKGNSNVIVSIHDGGIDYLHQDLLSNMWPSIGPDGTQTKRDRHGTHVAGTVSAVNNNGIGVAGVAGGNHPAKGALLMSLDIFKGSISTAQSFIYAADNGASISQNSWGYKDSLVFNTPDLVAIDYFYSNGGGTAMPGGGLVIFAAGNNNSNSIWYPAYYSKTVAVAATNQADQKANFSNYGTWIDISAPGVSVFSTDTLDNYVYLQGTSMACPHVSGVAALLVSYSPGTFSRSQILQAILSSTDNINHLNPLYNNQLGTGRLNAYKAVEQIQTVQGVNPSNLVAEPFSQSQINLSWSKNIFNNDVLVAFNTVNVFGPPSGNYQTNDLISGGGRVIYFGNQTTTQHTGLNPQQTYYYRAWSKLNDGNYSSGITTSAMTLCSTISHLPFFEDFNQGKLPDCWANVSNSGGEPGQIWTFNLITDGLPSSYGRYAILDSKSYGNGFTQNADLITPSFNLSNYDAVYLSFEHYYRHYHTSSATLSVSIDNGNSWSALQQWTSTTSKPTSFVKKIDQAANQPNVSFKWNFTGTWGYYWIVDNILITNQDIVSTNISNYTPYSVYPSPFDNYLVIDFGDAFFSDYVINIYNINGKPILNPIVVGSSKVEINTADIQKGIYLLVISSSSKRYTYRVVK